MALKDFENKIILIIIILIYNALYIYKTDPKVSQYKG